MSIAFDAVYASFRQMRETLVNTVYQRVILQAGIAKAESQYPRESPVNNFKMDNRKIMPDLIPLQHSCYSTRYMHDIPIHG